MVQAVREVHMMGTIIRLQINAAVPEPLLDELVRRLKIYEHRFSANADDSELMAITHQAGLKPVVVNPELYELIKIGWHYSVAADSNLNIAIGPLVQTWRIGFTDAKLPKPEEINAALAKIDPHQIILDDAQQSVFLQQPGMAIDLGSLAKGYIADLLIAYLRQHDVTSALVNLGGNVVTMGPMLQHDDQMWRIGIQDPVQPRGHYKTVVRVRNQSVVTSGIYERSLQVGGHMYHHILDVRTGYPLKTDLASLSIISTKSVDGELWTTRLFGQSRQAIMQKLAELPGIDGIVIMKDGTVYSSLD
ncbi:FAD:protein FMN transferase [Loigolactobacillus jiayinensis]|uniref:FAD:protein FMN transferase n=1 Tax=Loigolactobacillus jiayinensis TaxID=2486016 RepID=A0ABW1RF86_9LACO|nr:FAD:protein FMN transferase [Loigolactobacillus jiayinensis]